MELVLNTGTFESTLDDKGRVVIPAPLRERFAGTLVIFQGKENCVWVMTWAGYQHYISTIRKEGIENGLTYEEIEAFEYLCKSTNKTVSIDPKTGRIPIPAILRTYANLTKDCLVVSIKGHLEIWNADLHKEYMDEVRLINKSIYKKMQGKVSFFLEEGQE